MEPLRRHCRVFYETVQGAGTVKIFGINCYDTQKVMQAVYEMYRSRLFGEEKMIDWEEKTDVDKTWKKIHASGGRDVRELYVWRGEEETVFLWNP